jgi:hypothetical protein
MLMHNNHETENYHITYVQTDMHPTLDPGLEGMLQH